MKKKILFGVVAIAISVFVVYPRFKLQAVTDTCTGVSTTFTGTAPASVVAGKSFTISDITTRPDTSFGATVTSSTLNISATNASPSTYSQNNTSTNPSPTTGAATYTAFFPNWTLAANQSAGSQIVVKLVSVTAQVQGIGSINCPLSATLATINITSAAASGGSSSSPQSSSGSTSKKTTTTTPGSSAEVPKDEDTGTQETTAETSLSDAKTTSVIVNVIDQDDRAVKGAKVTLDNLPVLYTEDKGIAIFSDLSDGDHNLTVDFKGKQVKRKFNVSGQNSTDTLSIKLPSTSKTKFLILGIGSVVALLAVAATTFLLVRRHRAPTSQNLPPTNPDLPQSPGQLYQPSSVVNTVTPAPPVQPVPPQPEVITPPGNDQPNT